MSNVVSRSVADEDQVRWFKEDAQLHESMLRSYLRGRVPSGAEVDDVIPDSYLKIAKARRAPNSRAAWKTARRCFGLRSMAARWLCPANCFP